MKRMLVAGTALFVLAALPAAAHAEGDVYAGFPVTLKGYEGSATTSVSYGGQIARQVLHDSLKKLAGKGTGAPDAELKARMIAYFEGTDAGRAIIVPATKGPFVVKQSGVDELSKGTNLAGKTYKGAVPGMPNNMTGPELVSFWIDKASAAEKGFDAANGYDYPQLISKFLLGAVFYNQAVDNYLDEKLRADNKPNDKPYKEGAAYTGKEHSWDEAFGYFGTPAHTLSLTPQAVYEIAKQGSKSEKPEDALALRRSEPGRRGRSQERDGLRAGLLRRRLRQAGHRLSPHHHPGLPRRPQGDRGGERCGAHRRAAERAPGPCGDDPHQLGEGARRGRVQVRGLGLQGPGQAGDHPRVRRRSGQGLPQAYAKHWGELKGFALALQTGRDNLGETAVRLNRIIGFGPVLPNTSQVTDIDSAGNYVKDESKPLAVYQYDMLKLQNLMVSAFAVEARQNDQLSDMESLLEKLGDGASAEND